MGRYGRVNVFVVSPENVPDFRVPTDLRGFTTVPYDPRHRKGMPVEIPGLNHDFHGSALSPDLDATRIQALMANNKVGVFNITGCWLGDTPTVRRYRFPA